MVWMGMGEDDVGHRGRVDAGIGEAVGKLAGRRHEVGPCPDVEYRQPVTRLHDRHVAVGPQRIGRHAVRGQQRDEFVLRNVRKREPHRQRQMPVAQHRHLRRAGCQGLRPRHARRHKPSGRHGEGRRRAGDEPAPVDPNRHIAWRSHLRPPIIYYIFCIFLRGGLGSGCPRIGRKSCA